MELVESNKLVSARERSVVTSPTPLVPRQGSAGA